MSDIKSYDLDFLRLFYESALELMDARYHGIWGYAKFRARLADALEVDLLEAEAAGRSIR